MDLVVAYDAALEALNEVERVEGIIGTEDGVMAVANLARSVLDKLAMLMVRVPDTDALASKVAVFAVRIRDLVDEDMPDSDEDDNYQDYIIHEDAVIAEKIQAALDVTIELYEYLATLANEE